MCRGFDVSVLIRNALVTFEPTFKAFAEDFSMLLNSLQETVKFPRIETLVNVGDVDHGEKLLEVCPISFLSLFSGLPIISFIIVKLCLVVPSHVYRKNIWNNVQVKSRI